VLDLRVLSRTCRVALNWKKACCMTDKNDAYMSIPRENMAGFDCLMLEKHCLYYAAILGASLWATWITWMPFLHVSFLLCKCCPAFADIC